MNMNLQAFIKDFADQFDDTDASEIKEETIYQDLDEWSSLIVLSIIAFVKTQYGKTITGKQIRSCKTVKELYDLVVSL
jgi:acyl carrier protein